jgi:AAA domain
LYGIPGVGKTTLVGSLPPEETGICACDSGNGSGLLPICERPFEYFEPTKLIEVEDFAKGKVFKNKKWLVLDNLSTLARTIIKDAALAIPISGSASRAIGVPDLKDYGTIAEFTRRILNTLIGANPDTNIVVLAHERYDRVNEQDAPGSESMIGPDLSGQLFLAAPSLFDFVLRLRIRSLLKNPADAKTRFYQRYIQCSPVPGVMVKCRAHVKGKQVLDAEEAIDLGTGQGTFPYLLDKIRIAYAG